MTHCRGGRRAIVVWLTLVMAVVVSGCSGSDTSEPAAGGGEPATSAESADPDAGAADTEGDASGEGATAGDTETVDAADEPAPALDRAGFVEVVEVDAGDEVTDAAGNLVEVRSIRVMPDALVGLDQAVAVEAVASSSELVGVELAMCRAGQVSTADIDLAGTGWAAISVSGDVDEGLDADREVVAPDDESQQVGLLEPQFVLPDPGACAAGWILLPADDAAVARYRLIDASTEAAYLYQWSDVGAPVSADAADDAEGDAATEDDADDGSTPFRPGEVVTFNAGPVTGTTVRIEGWQERPELDGPVERTRVVSLELEVCPSTAEPIEFGLAVDGWNALVPIDPTAVIDPTTAATLAISGECVEGQLDFAAPFGTRPTGFWVSDGSGDPAGIAWWSLEGAALAPS